jgi:radical SAM protein (TIGR01212 family)
MHYTPYRDLLLKLFPNYLKVRKLPLNGGMSCPNLDGTKGFAGCSYCNNRSFSPVFDQAQVAIQEQLDKFVPRLREKYPNAGILAYLQPYTNTHAPLEKLQGIIDPIIKHKEIAGLAIGTRPDCLGEEIMGMLRRLQAIKPVWLELGLQTVHEESARRIRRGYRLPVFEESYRRLKREGFPVIVHLIFSLPGESREDMLQSVRYLAALDPPPDGVKLQMLHVLRGTALGEDYLRAPFPLLSLEEYAALIAESAAILPAETVFHRVTGDGPGKLLIAPDWTRNKKRVLNTINARLREKGEPAR